MFPVVNATPDHPPSFSIPVIQVLDFPSILRQGIGQSHFDIPFAETRAYSPLTPSIHDNEEEEVVKPPPPPPAATASSSIIVALSLHVVVLIKDLNGNHVIRKCLNKLAPEHNQYVSVFAFWERLRFTVMGAVSFSAVLTTSDHQRIELVDEITYNALTLVQGPYGNCVIQYILDLNDNRFGDAVIRQFSSNIIEKCIRVAENGTREVLIDELLNRARLEIFLRNSYGNHCVQTALDYTELVQRTLLVADIIPVLPLILDIPYGKRIQNKL